MTLCVNRP